MKRKIEDKQDEIARFDSKYYKKLSEKGALESEKKHHETAIKEREELIRGMSSRLGIKGYDVGGLSEDQIRQFGDRIEEDLKKMRKDWEAIRDKGAKEENDKSTAYQDLRSTLRAKEGSRDSQADGLKRVKARAKGLQQEMDGMSITSLDIETAEKEHADLVAQGEALMSAQAKANYDGKIREKNDEIRKMDEQREDITSELNTLNRQADFRAKLDMKRRSAEQKQTEANSLMERHRDALKKATGKDVNGEEAEQEVQEAVAAKEKTLETKERAEQESNKKLQHIESTLTFSRKQLKEKESQADAIDKEIRAVLDGEDFTQLDDAIADAERESKICRDELNLLQNASKFFENAVRHGHEKHSCVTCGRGIKEDENEKVFNYMKEMIRKSQPARQAEEQENLDAWQSQLQKFTAAKPKEVQMQALRSGDIPQLRQQVEEAEEKLNGLRSEAEETSNEVDECKTEVRDLNNLRRVAADIGRILKEVATLRSEASNLERDLASTGSSRTGDEVQKEIDDLAAGIRGLKRELQTLQQDKESTRTQISSHERNVHRVEMTLTQKRQTFSRREELQKRFSELQKEQEDTQQSLNDLQKEIEASAEPIRKAREELENVKREATRLEGEARKKMQDLSALVKQLETAETTVQSYIRQRGEQKLKDCQDALDDLQRQSKEVQAEVAVIEKDVTQIEKDLNESRATERNIHDNLRYIQLGREITSIDEELDSLDLEESHKLNKVWTEKYNTSKRLENDLNGRAAHIGGEIASLKSQIKAREHELRDEYKNVDKRFTTKLVEVKTSELANNDLELYQKALHAAIMKFHSIKMEEINRNLSVLWAETYQGTDIDTISIRADGEGTGARSTYNYRVVMVKDSVEMDMRGRCSAGQKCLASILIRLALADSFSANCGIMALDEPTTNLDGETVSALAESLSNLIKERRAQSNFQLIIITHDENFLSMLSRNTGLEWYFRVAREQIEHRHRSYIARERV
jgi:DNA repair protein RAD50